MAAVWELDLPDVAYLKVGHYDQSLAVPGYKTDTEFQLASMNQEFRLGYGGYDLISEDGLLKLPKTM
jgi:hypothetical protein